MISEQQIIDQLRTVKYPGFTRDIISFGLIKGIRIEGSTVSLNLHITTTDTKVPHEIEEASRAAVQAIPGVEEVAFQTQITAPLTAAMQAGPGTQTKIEGVEHVIVVASGKGGVGKSTVSANLALALSKFGLKVGLCDCDIYGPSVALMYGACDAQPTATEDERINPVDQYGIRLMSMGFLLGDDSPAILRGPMVTRYTQQFLRNVAWGKLDVLVLDLPPGTGDIQLTIVQTVRLSGAIIVTTPQEVALIDARKAAAMFRKVSVSILGLVENMSYFLCPSDQKRYDIFGTGGGQREAERLGVPLLGQIPLDMETRIAGDEGKPIVLSQPESQISQAFIKTAEKLHKKLLKN